MADKFSSRVTNETRRLRRLLGGSTKHCLPFLTFAVAGNEASDAGGTGSWLTHRWREPDSNLYGAFPVKWCFSVYCQFFVRSGKGRSSSRRLRRSGSRSAEWGQGTETLAKLGA